MKLQDYPQEIFKTRTRILNLSEQVMQCEQTLSIIGIRIEKQVLEDASLSNDAKRKAKRLDLQQSDLDYCVASNELKAAQLKREESEIYLQRLLNEFSVLKLAERRAIAAIELQASGAN